MKLKNYKKRTLLKILSTFLCLQIFISFGSISVLAKESKKAKYDGAYDLENLDYIMKEEKKNY